MKEIEAKFAAIEKDALRMRLKAEGYGCVVPECLMRRKIFKFVQDRNGYYARVRDEGNRVTMTVKEHVAKGIDGVHEAEITINDFDEGVRLLEMAGWQTKAYQETKREIWCHPVHNTEVVIDTWPGIPAFCEIEGASEEAVHAAAKELGFSWKSAFFGAVDVMYQYHMNLPPETINNMAVITFDNPPVALAA